MTIRELGRFPRFGKGGDEILVSASLKSASNLNGGTVSGAAAYDAALGVNFADGASGIYWTPTAAQRTALKNGGRISFEVSKSFFECAGNIPAAILALVQSFTVSPNSGTQHIWLRKETTPRLSGNIDATASRFETTSDGKPDMCRVDISWDYTVGRIYVDYLECSRFSVAALTSASFTTIWLGSDKTITGVHNGTDSAIYSRNWEIATQPIVLTTKKSVSNLHVYGDSLPEQGDYPDDGVATELATVGETDHGGTQDHAVDNGMLPGIHRALARAGFTPGSTINRSAAIGNRKLRLYAVGGAGVNQGNSLLSEQVDAALAAGDIPSAAIIVCGSNDVSANDAVGEAPTKAAFKTSYQTEIDRLVAAGCGIIELATITSLEMTETYVGAGYMGRTDEYNAAIQELGDENAEVTVCDLFTKTGGHSFNASLFKTGDDRHPSKLGSGVMGQWLGEALAGRLV